MQLDRTCSVLLENGAPLSKSEGVAFFADILFHWAMCALFYFPVPAVNSEDFGGLSEAA